MVKYLAILFLWWFPPFFCHANAGIPQLKINAISGHYAGYIADGMLLGRGVLITQQPHIGAKFRCYSRLPDTPLTSCVLQGKNNPQHLLRIKIKTSQPVINSRAGNDDIILFEQPQLSFLIIAEGKQSVFPDSYQLLMATEIINNRKQPLPLITAH